MSPLFGRRGGHRPDDEPPHIGPREVSEELARIHVRQISLERVIRNHPGICLYAVHNNVLGFLIVWENQNGRFGEWYTQVSRSEVVAALKELRVRFRPERIPPGQVGSPVTRSDLVSCVEVLITGFRDDTPEVTYSTNIEWPSV